MGKKPRKAARTAVGTATESRIIALASSAEAPSDLLAMAAVTCSETSRLAVRIVDYGQSGRSQQLASIFRDAGWAVRFDNDLVQRRQSCGFVASYVARRVLPRLAQDGAWFSVATAGAVEAQVVRAANATLFG